MPTAADATTGGGTIVLNGAPYPLGMQCTVEALLRKLEITGRSAVEINGQIVPQSLHASHMLHTGDRVEIVHAVGGG